MVAVDIECYPKQRSTERRDQANKAVTKKLIETIKTPCIGVCSTGIGDSVCRGCKRFAHEVIHWNSYSHEQKQLIDQRLEKFLAQIVATKLRVTNQNLLQWHLETQQIPYPQHKSVYLWAYELLRAGASQLGDLSVYGLMLDAQYRDADLRQLRLEIDSEFFILSQAHYDRYFPSPGNSWRREADESNTELHNQSNQSEFDPNLQGV